MLTLRLFGGLSLADESAPIVGRATQRRRLAILAMLAVARGKPVSRDKLIALLWPDASDERARHLLADSLYVIRDALGEEVIRATGGDLSLDGSRISSDVAAFADALDAGDRQLAVSLYAAGGPFLDGVFLPDAGEFERWAESTRSRLAGDYRRALEQLAAAASAADDHESAIKWWRQLTAEDQLSSRAALGLMTALAAAGDRSGALAFARTYAAVVRAELESEPDPAIIALEEKLRANSKPTPVPNKANGEPKVALPSSTQAEAAPAPRRSRVLFATLAIALVIAGYGLTIALGATPGRSFDFGAEPSVAVLPLMNVGADSTNDRFVDGMTEELISAIATAGRLRVIARTSSFAFKGHSIDVRSIAESLHVKNILEGGLNRSGERIHLSVRLVNAATGAIRWSHVYERTFDNLFAVEDDVARAVSSALDVQLVDHAQRKSPSAEAFELFLSGSDQRLLRSDSTARMALAFFSSAVQKDSSFAAAFAGLARSYSALCQGRAPLSDRRIACDNATVAAERAIALDSTFAPGYAALSYARAMVLDINGARVAAERAVALDPNQAEAHDFLSLAYQWAGRQDEAMAEARHALSLDPLAVDAISELARALFYAGRDDEALLQLASLRALRPPVRRVRMIVGKIYEKKKMWSVAMREFATNPQQGRGDRPDLMGQLLAKSGHRTEAETILADLEARWAAGQGKAFEVASVYAGLGDFDNAFLWIGRSIDDFSLRVDIMDPTFAEVRADPRFARVQERLALRNR